MLMVGQVPESQLFHETLRKTFLYRKSIVDRPFILPVIIDFQLITRNRIIILVFRQGNFPRSTVFVVFFTGGIFLQDRVFLQFFPYTLLQFLRRQLYQLDSLYLQRRQLLRLFQFQSLLKHGTPPL